MNSSSALKQAAAIVAIGALLASCGGGSSGSGGPAAPGAFTLRITDGPIESAEHVYVQFSGIELQSMGGTRTTLYYCEDAVDPNITVVSSAPCSTEPAPKQLDLLALTGGEADYLLDGYLLPSGHYEWIRLMVDTDGLRDSYIVLVGGAAHELAIPSGSQSGLKLNRGIDVPAGGSADFTIDFDLRKSVHVTGTGEYLLRPTLRLADNTRVGAIAGTVDPTLVPAGCTPAIYVFAGAGVTPDDIDGVAPEPVTTATVKLDSGSGAYLYKAAYLEAGDYTVAYTCQAGSDDPVVDNALSFTGTATVAVTASTVTTHNF
jgi:hypothetical protein